MMLGYGHHVSGWGWFTMSAGVILLWVLIITIAVRLNRSREHVRSRATPPAEDVLHQRPARGEIDQAEFRRRSLDALHAPPGAPARRPGINDAGGESREPAHPRTPGP
ncbi:SHOCT domain-containing protein [Streptomyces longwoodensis]|uniref:SHOCT domain-containing protein n=1 Tax=Streptomyces longwoodensis TaxID=68231 RepID=UPI0037024200